MELTMKGAEVALPPSFDKLKVTLDWFGGTDLDICALCIDKDGREHFVYFNNKGALDKMPFILLPHDDGVDTGKVIPDDEPRTEEIIVANFKQMKSIYFICLDYTSIKDSVPSTLEKSRSSIRIEDSSGTKHVVNLDVGEAGKLKMANALIFALLDNSGIVPVIQNLSLGIVLKDISGTKVFWDLIAKDNV